VGAVSLPAAGEGRLKDPLPQRRLMHGQPSLVASSKSMATRRRQVKKATACWVAGRRVGPPAALERVRGDLRLAAIPTHTVFEFDGVDPLDAHLPPSRFLGLLRGRGVAFQTGRVRVAPGMRHWRNDGAPRGASETADLQARRAQSAKNALLCAPQAAALPPSPAAAGRWFRRGGSLAPCPLGSQAADNRRSRP
jgi:hypothetical protein